MQVEILNWICDTNIEGIYIYGLTNNKPGYLMCACKFETYHINCIRFPYLDQSLLSHNYRDDDDKDR